MILIAIGLVAFLALSRTAAAGQDLRVEFTRIHQIGFEGITPYVDLALRFTNSRAVNMTIQNVFFTVVNGSQVQLGTIDMPNLNLVIQANNVTERVFRLRLSLLNVAAALLNKDKIRSLIQGISLNGSVLVNNIRVPINNLTLRQTA